jgi:60 kDa SS-A/Ro ribonucleoprotein
MAKFNTSAASANRVTNVAGGSAYKMTPELELVSALLTSFLEDKFYQKGSDRITAIKDAITKVDPLFAAKAAVYARTEFGMRSVSHVAAAEIAATVKGEQWTKRFFDRVVFRPDDMTEILSYYYANYGKNEPQAMRKGFAKAFERFDEYQLAKYRGASKSVKLVDVVNVVHPANSEAIAKLVKDELRNADTFEAKLSKAGQSDSPDSKQETWSELVTSGKLGYFALLRNLRNIIEDAPEVVPQAIEQLVNPKAIKKSLVLPFRFLTAAEEIGKIPGPEAKKVIMGISTALDVSASNIPKFEGETLVAIDKSGSMQGEPIRKSALFGAMLVKSNAADVILWDDNATILNCNPMDSVTTIANQILARVVSMGGTNIMAPFQLADRKYSRILILTDEQSWGHSSYYSTGTGPSALAAYKTRTGANPMVYNWDMQGHGTLQFPENQVAVLAGWSDKVFDIMKLVETDKHALVNKIKAIEV